MSLYRKFPQGKIKDYQILIQALESLNLEFEALPLEQGINQLGFRKVQIEISLPNHRGNMTGYKAGVSAMAKTGKARSIAGIDHFQIEGDFDFCQWTGKEFAIMVLRAYVTIGAEALLRAQGFETLQDWQAATDADEIPFEHSRGVNVRELVRVQ